MTKKATIQTIINIPAEDYKSFRTLYPAYGTWTWFVRECLASFLDLHSEDPNDLIKEVVRDIKERREVDGRG